MVSGRTGQRVSRRDVAKAAGVSLTTVTHALNSPPGVRMKSVTKELVRETAKRLGYRPSYVGRALVTGKTATIGLLQPEFTAVTSLFYQRMIQELARSMEADDYHLLLLFDTPEKRYKKVISRGQVDGLIVLRSRTDTKLAEEIPELDIPTLTVNFSLRDSSIPSVHSDNRNMIRNVIDEMSEAGCRSILAIHDYREAFANREIFEEFAVATGKLADKGIVGSTIIPSRNFREQVRNLWKSEQRWDGIFIDCESFVSQFIEETVNAGITPGKDFHFITSLCLENYTSIHEYENCIYVQQPLLVGEKAWKQMKILLNKGKCNKEEVVPYLRIAGAKIKK